VADELKLAELAGGVMKPRHQPAGGITGGAVNPDRALGPAIMSGTFTSVGVYVAAEILGGIAAALLYTRVVAGATAPTTDRGDPQQGAAAGDRALATGSETTTAEEPS